ncbi:AI-2E family transporter [Sphingomonas crusticola]|uniref:AI-2E family transporter n=1 Tax=Sphingomonas crusticola TaxID=1697973 RepID=UPI000E23FECA|nr:AI-2E family transporter [Sphingomonas crusticola]
MVEDHTHSHARAHRIAKASLGIVLVLFGIWLSATFIPALLWAVIIAIAIDPLYARAETRWPGGRKIWLPTLATLLIALLVLAPLTIGVVEAAREARTVLHWLADARANGLAEPDWVRQLPFANEISGWWQDNLATPEGTALQWDRVRGSVLGGSSELVGRNLLHRSVVFAFTLIALFFLLRERDGFVDQLQTAGKRLFGSSGDRLGAQLIRSVRGTIDGLVLVGIGEGAVMAVFYVIAGVPHPLLLGLLTAVAAMIPFGAAVLFGVAALMLFGQGAVGWAIAIIIIGLVVVGIADHFVRPFLIGGSTRLPFLWVLIGILGGVESLGLLGLFVGPATMAMLILLWRDYIAGAEKNPTRPLPAGD